MTMHDPEVKWSEATATVMARPRMLHHQISCITHLLAIHPVKAHSPDLIDLPLV
jgi:hypothetical protein